MTALAGRASSGVLDAGKDAAGHTAARIGPNAIIRLGEALREAEGAGAEADLFAQAGLSPYLAAPPGHMVDERDVIRLHAALRHGPFAKRSPHIAWRAGLLTGDYLLANRIPRPVQGLLRHLPSPLASRVLLKAIARNAWTFAGSGHFRYAAGRPVRLEIENCPICRGESAPAALCAYYGGTFQRLFEVLVNASCRVVETHCAAAGATSCRFEIVW